MGRGKGTYSEFIGMYVSIVDVRLKEFKKGKYETNNFMNSNTLYPISDLPELPITFYIRR